MDAKRRLVSFQDTARLQWLRLGVPALLFLIVLGFEVMEHFVLSHQGVDANFVVESLLFGVIGPLMVYVALGWLMQLYLERSRAAQELRRLNEELQRQDALRRRLLHKIMVAQEEERRRIARQLHDEFAQGLMAFQLSVDALFPYLKGAPSGLVEEVRRAHDLADDMLRQTRQLMLDLRPPPLDELGLVPALRDLAVRILEPRGVRVSVTRWGKPYRLGETAEIALYRMGQECLMNALKHAQPKSVQVVVMYEPDRVCMEVRDDGCGFDPRSLPDPGDHGGWGLLGIRERCILLGGSMEVNSAPGQGTTVRFEIPTNAARVDG